MQSDSWSRVEEIVLASLEMEEPQRSHFLVSECGNDNALRDEIESLLAYENTAPDLIDSLSHSAFRRLADYREQLDERSKTDLEDLNGKTVSHYLIQEKLGEGGMGVVYKALDTRLNRIVALKFLLRLWTDRLQSSSADTDAGTDAGTADFPDYYSEARASSALDHPNICTIYEAGQHEGVPYIVMQLLDGESLKQRIDTSRLSPDQALDLAAQITAAMDAAHAAGIIHRDIKPANIFITQRGEAKILDFGLATRTIRHDLDFANQESHQAAPHIAETIAGTTAYMSPQQVLGHESDTRSDIFSLGIVLYEMTTGVSPFRGDTINSTFDSILHKIPPPPSKLNPGMPPELDQIIGKALEKDCAARYQTVAELGEDLRRLKAARHTESLRPVWTPQARWGIATGLAAVTLALLIASALLYRNLRQQPQHAQAGEQAIVLGDFANTTGDSVFNDTLRESLRIQLEQSPFLNVLSDARLHRELAFMERPAGTSLTNDVAQQICQRTGSIATVNGLIAPMGSHFLLRIFATGCQDDKPLGSAEIEVNGRESVLHGLDTISTQLRSKLGESLPSIQAYDKTAAQATTSSLEALQAYSLGIKTAFTEGQKAAIPYFEKAIHIDPQFAMAYAKLGVTYAGLDLGSSDSPIAPIRQAYQLRDRVSDRERFYIDSQYNSIVTGDQDKTIATLQLWTHIYPRDPAPYANLGVAYAYLGRHQESVHEALQALNLEPTAGILYANLASEYCSLRQLNDCERMINEAHAHNVNHPVFIGLLYQLAFLRGDEDEMHRQLESAQGHPWVEGWLLAMQADTAAYRGRVEEAREYSARAVRSARKYDGEDTTKGYLAVAALREAEFGNRQQARSLANTVLKGPSGQGVKIYAALALAQIGDTNHAQAVADKLHQKYPDDTLLNFYWLPAIEAAIAISNHNPAKAIDLLRATVPYELGLPKSPTNVAAYPIYLRGIACLQAGLGSQAETEFRKILDRPGLIANYPLGSLAHLGLARAYLLQAGHAAKKSLDPQPANTGQPSDKGKDSSMLANAEAAYADFLRLWNHADPANPILAQARAESRPPIQPLNR